MVVSKVISLFLIATFSFNLLASCPSLKLHRQGLSLEEKKQFLLSSNLQLVAMSLACDEKDLFETSFAASRALYELGETNLAFDVTTNPPTEKDVERVKILHSFYNEDLRPNLPKNLKDRYEVFEEDMRKIKDQKVKSPWVAGGLSALLPGAGQAYSGDYQSAFIVFFLNAIFLSSAIELGQKDMDASAATLWTAFSVTYVGGIISATKIANDLNDNSNRREMQNLKQRSFPELNVKWNF